MKVNELMIGDLVSYCGFYNKVIYIGQKVSMYNGKGTEFTTDPEYIRPIPLTEEILVKNGFACTQNKEWPEVLYWELETDDFAIDENRFTDYVFYNYAGIHIDYVHQLQHLLRMAGVQKEIEL